VSDKRLNIYAIKSHDEWHLATMAFNSEYNLEPSYKMVWADHKTTALICPVGEEQVSMIIEVREK